MSANDTYDAFMMDHAAGSHPAAFALAGDIHVMLSPKGAEAARIWSVIGGALFESAGQQDVILSVRQSPPERIATTDDAANLIALADTALDWRKGLSGVSLASTATPGGKFMKLEPGQAAPMHGHSSLEATVVIRGRFSDGHAEYGRGDLVLGEPGMRHKPQAVGNQPCICFVAQRPNIFRRLFS